jgi:hypothetical protein
MVHVARPEGDGFLLLQVWRTEGEARRSFEESIRPELTRLGLTHGELTTWPVWSLARP